jgi:hypothetical protein
MFLTAAWSGASGAERERSDRFLQRLSKLRLAGSDLLTDPAVRGHERVRIEIEMREGHLWAMLTLTEYATQRITVITSQ